MSLPTMENLQAEIAGSGYHGPRSWGTAVPYVFRVMQQCSD